VNIPASNPESCGAAIDSEGVLRLLFATTTLLRPNAEVAELADARDSKSRGTWYHGGSTPPFGTSEIKHLQRIEGYVDLQKGVTLPVTSKLCPKEIQFL
jgi:hypothetical protein